MNSPALDHATLEMLHEILEDAWQELLNRGNTRAELEDEQANRDLLARRLMQAAKGGERDPVRLKRYALTGLVE